MFMRYARCFFMAFSALLLLGTKSWAGSPEGFVDVPWGAKLPEAKQIMLKREGVRVKEETPERLVLTGGKYTEYPVERWELEFALGGFYRGKVFLVIPPGKAKDGDWLADHQFNDLLRAMTLKYGQFVKPNNPGEAQGLWKWNVSDPHSGESLVRSVVLSFKWSDPQVFKVQYANQLPWDPDIPASPKAPEPPQPPPPWLTGQPG